jgi:ornithine cyclodeaminase/alanine dehydrogenase
VVDNLNQCATIGDLHHAIEHGTMTREAIHSDLGSIVAGKKPGREHDDEITVFDSTGIALEDAVTAALVLRRAVDQELGTRFDFA